MASRPSRREVDQKPLKLVPANESSGEEIRLGANPSLLLKKGSQIRYAVINGFVYDLSQDRDRIRRAWK